MGISYLSSWRFFIHATSFALVLWTLLGSPTTITSATIFGGGNETDRLALLAFKHQITNDPLGVMTSWNDSLHFCGWFGVTCADQRQQRVTILDLSSQSLVGSISSSIVNLTFLEILDLTQNNLNGGIPQEIGHLFRLEELHLSNNSLGGEIPATLSNCTNLRSIYLLRNTLVGKIPVELGFMLNLKILALDRNNFNGEIPYSFGNLSSLEVLSLGSDNLEGRIPDSLSRLTSLTCLELGLNNLSGMVPFSIYNHSSIGTLGMAFNKLHGSLPPDLGFTLPNLQVLSIVGNQFSGPIPVSIGNASKLARLEIGYNNFTGKVPNIWGSLQCLFRLHLNSNNLGSGEADDLSFFTTLSNCSSLESLGLDGNQFGGELPNSMTNLSSQLTFIALGRNRLSGSIPMGIGNLINLTQLGLESNLLTGSLPTSIGMLRKLQKLTLYENRFSGNIPSSIGNLTLLNSLYLNQNNFNGSIPPSLGYCNNLLLLNLSLNNFSGNIPPQVLSISSLSVFLDLSRNHFTGLLPSVVSNLNNLRFLDVSENKLSGEIPNNLGKCRSLVYLYMQGNFFQGAIPSSLVTLSAIEQLDISRNNISGQIPKYFSNFPFLQYLNLSFNDLEGEVPVEGVFINLTEFSIIGNSKLCGGIPILQLPTCPIKKPKKQGMSLAIKFIVASCSGVLCFILVSLLIIYRRKKARKEQPSKYSPRNQLLKISYQELQKMTGGFSSTNLIGAGSFSSVFKGILDQDESVVAVKVFNLQQQGASKSFFAECDVLKNIRHRNLVKVITSCSTVDFQGNDFKALVYEFMPNGSLERWLHPETDGHVQMKNLNFLQRLNIAIDVAVAMDYLHRRCETPIIHCDIKPSNILLDNDMTAHVSDFGLSRFLAEATNRTSHNQTCSIGIKGSIGYMAPEYGMGSVVSIRGDVYSYGILLLEIVTGKRPTNDMFKDGLNIHNFAKMSLPERVMEIVDPTLVFVEEEEEEEEEGGATNLIQNNWGNSRKFIIQECLIAIVEIGVACSMESPRERINMNDVVRELNLIRNLFLDFGIHGG